MKTWYGSEPTACDICASPIKDTFIDGRTREGAWGILCPRCHKNHGVGLGLGKGQQYWKRYDVWVDTDIKLTDKEMEYLLKLAKPFDHTPIRGGSEPEEDTPYI